MVGADPGPAPAHRCRQADYAGLIVTSEERPNFLINKVTMDTSPLLLAILTLCLVGVTFHAWRLGNEKRDVVLLGVFSALLGAGTAVAAIL